MVGLMTVDDVPATDSTPDDSFDIAFVSVRSTSNRRISIPVKVEAAENTEPLNALIDCGAEGLFIDKKIASNWRKKNIRPIRVRNVDGTENVDGRITEKCLITFYICGKRLTKWFYVTALGDQSLILGLPWLEKHNPIIDWADKTLEF